jgi:hypothetical protein
LAEQKGFILNYQVIIKQEWKRKPRRIDILNLLFDEIRDKKLEYEILKETNWKENFTWKKK